MNYYYPLFLALLTVHAQASSCPNVTVLTDFQINKLAGSWFVFEADQSNLSPELKCTVANFTVIGPRNVICIVSGVQTGNGNPYSYAALLSIVGAAKQGQFMNDVVSGDYRAQFGINILGVDKDSFHIWYGCDPKTNIVQAFLVSRQRQVPDSVRAKCHEILRQNNINPSDFSRVDQENCSN